MHLIVPSRPTPNGPLHLGHIAGPYLRSDILKRYLEGNGKCAFLASSCDVFDGWILQAIEEDQNVIAIRKNIDQIRADLAVFNIQFDYFGDPFDPEELYDLKLLMGEIQCSGHHAIHNWPKHILDQKLVFGSDISGTCPTCFSDVLGVICESCGQVCLPFDSQPQKGDLWRANLISKHRYSSAAIYFDGACQAAQHFHPKKYMDGVNTLRHNANGRIYPTLIPISSQAKEILGYKGEGDFVPFAPSSHLMYRNIFERKAVKKFGNYPVCSTSFIGKDGLFGHLILSPQIADSFGLRDYDNVEINSFLNLDGRKFSTSRNHAVWAHEIPDLIPDVDVDFWRLHLASIDMTKQDPNFSISAARNSYQSWYAPMWSWVDQYNGQAPHCGAEIGVLSDAFERAQSTIKIAMGEHGRKTHVFAQTLIEWIEIFPRLDEQQRFFWHNCLRDMGQPILTTLFSKNKGIDK